MRTLKEFGIRYLNGDLPPWWYRVWLSLTSVALYKTIEQTSVRPLGIRPCLSRVFHRLADRQNRQAMRDYLEPQQVALSPGGAAKLVHQIRMGSEANRGFMVVKMDIKNAFNSIARASILEVMVKEESLRHMAWHAGTCLAPSFILETGGRRWG